MMQTLAPSRNRGSKASPGREKMKTCGRQGASLGEAAMSGQRLLNFLRGMATTLDADRASFLRSCDQNISKLYEAAALLTDGEGEAD